MTKINDATEFLETLAPDGAWAVTAIYPDSRKHKTETQTFFKRGNGDVAMRNWLDERADEANLYYHLNSVRGPVTKKAGRKDIGAVRALHVDLDPDDLPEHSNIKDPAKWLKMEQERILGLLTHSLPKGVPDPSLIVFSGNGFQAIWLLDEGDWIKTNGDLGLAEDAKLFNVHLERLFGGDNCHNIDRLLRLPFTTNRPDAKKIAKGRVPVETGLVKRDFHLTYPLSAFMKAKPIQSMGTDDRIDVHIGEPERPEGQQLLDAGVSPRLLEIIINGHDPNNPKEGDNSRSAWVCDVARNLARAGVRAELIAGAFLELEWNIGDSIREHRDPVYEAKRQTMKAIQFVETERETQKDEQDEHHRGWLEKMNADHCVLMREGGHCRVMTWDTGEIDKRKVPTLQSRTDFENSYANKTVTIPAGKGTKEQPVGQWWFQHPKRRQYTAMRFDPSTTDEVLPGNYLNLWKGLEVTPAHGDWGRMRKHITDVIAAGDPACAQYLLKWAAWTLQNPQHPAEVAVVMKGGRGTGKGFFGRAMADIFGQHGLHMSGPGHLTSRFNLHLRDAVLIFADEALVPGDKQAESIIKTLITEPTLIIEGKGQNAIQARNMVHLIMASNEEWVVPAGVDERRFFVVEVAPKTKDRGDHYFAALDQELKNGGLEAMAHDLLNMELGNWHPRRDVPQTAALRDQKLRSLRPFDDWLLGVLEAGFVPGRRPNKDFGCVTVIGSTDGGALGLFDQMAEVVPALKHLSTNKLGRELKRKHPAWAARGQRARSQSISMSSRRFSIPKGEKAMTLSSLGP